MKEDYNPNFEEENSKETAQLAKDKHKKIKTKEQKSKFGSAVKILFITLAISFCFGILSELLMTVAQSLVGTIVAILLLMVFIFISIICDMIGVATASADIEPFRAMASKKVRGAKEAIAIIKNADKASSFFCDIVGDACGIMCGSIGAAIVAIMAINGDILQVVIASLVSALIAGMTVFGKAVGKSYAISKANTILLKVGVFVSMFKIKKKK